MFLTVNRTEMHFVTTWSSDVIDESGLRKLIRNPIKSRSYLFDIVYCIRLINVETRNLYLFIRWTNDEIYIIENRKVYNYFGQYIKLATTVLFKCWVRILNRVFCEYFYWNWHSSCVYFVVFRIETNQFWTFYV